MRYIDFDAKKPLYCKPIRWHLWARRVLLSTSDAAWNTTCAIWEELSGEGMADE